MRNTLNHPGIPFYKNLLKLASLIALLLTLITCGGDVKVEESATSSGFTNVDTGPLSISFSTQPQVGSSTTIKGTFKDASGNPVSSKALSVTDVLHNETTSLTTDSSGNFEFTTKTITLPIAVSYLISDGSTSYMMQIVPSNDMTAEELISDITTQLSQSTTSSAQSAKLKKGKTYKNSSKKSSATSTSSENIQINYYSMGSYTNQGTSYSFSQLRDESFLQNLTDADVLAIHNNIELQYWRTLQSRTVTATDKEVILTLEDGDFRNRYGTAAANAQKNDMVVTGFKTVLFGACAVVAMPAAGTGIGVGVSAVCFSMAMDSAWNTYNAFIDHMEETGRYTHDDAENWRNNVDKAEVGLAILGLATASVPTEGFDDIIALLYSAYNDSATLTDYIPKSSVSSASKFTIGANTWDFTLLECSKNTTITDTSGSQMTVWDSVPVYLPVVGSIPTETTTYSTSGTVTASDSGLQGVTMLLTTSEGSLVAATFTNSTGQYSFKVVNTGGYIITPSKSGYTFSPTNLAVNVSGDVSGKDFVGSASGSTNSLVGTWVMIIDHGEPVFPGDGTYTFTETTWTFTTIWDGGSCTSSGTYSLSGNTIAATWTASECEPEQIGGTGTATYSISGDTLTLTMSDGSEVYARQ